MRTKGQMVDNSKLVNQKGLYIIYYIVGSNAAVVNL